MSYIELDFNSLPNYTREVEMRDSADTALMAVEGLAMLSTDPKEFLFAEWIPAARAYGVFIEGRPVTFLPAEAVHKALKFRADRVKGYIGSSTGEGTRMTRRLDSTLVRIGRQFRGSSSVDLQTTDRGWLYEAPRFQGTLLGMHLQELNGGSFTWSVSRPEVLRGVLNG